MKPLQQLTLPWLYSVFGTEAYRPEYRVARLLEEAMELAQVMGLHPQSIHDLVDYVYHRPVGEPIQEVGGVMLTALACAERLGIDASDAATAELARCLAFTDEQRERMRSKNRPAARPL